MRIGFWTSPQNADWASLRGDDDAPGACVDPGQGGPALTLDHLTGGRYIVDLGAGRYVMGLGAGWPIGEQAAFGIDLPPIGKRFDRYEAYVRVVKALFGDPAREPPGVTLEAPPFRLDRATIEPGFLRRAYRSTNPARVRRRRSRFPWWCPTVNESGTSAPSPLAVPMVVPDGQRIRRERVAAKSQPPDRCPEITESPGTTVSTALIGP